MSKLGQFVARGSARFSPAKRATRLGPLDLAPRGVGWLHDSEFTEAAVAAVARTWLDRRSRSRDLNPNGTPVRQPAIRGPYSTQLFRRIATPRDR